VPAEAQATANPLEETMIHSIALKRALSTVASKMRASPRMEIAQIPLNPDMI
jgi:hypothetical protein